jgi:hypothetical protein
MDLALDPAMLPELPPPGHILQVGAWLSGRLAPENDEK